MSRRKQARPRHLDDDVELGTSSTADTDNVFAVKSLPETLKLPMSGEEETEQDDTSELEHASPPSVSPNSDAHVCGKCRAEFLELSDFIAHKKECSKEKVVILYDQNQTGTEDQSELCNINGVSSRLSEDPEMDNLEAVSQNGGSDGEHSFEKFSKAGDEVDAGVGLGEENLEEQSESALNEMEEDELKSLVNDDDDNIDDDLDSLKEDELEDEIKPELNNDIPPYMLPLAHLLPNANVMLEPLQATKAAVAQFAENNLPTQDANALHGALFNLQQQQIMQLQLIHQLQQQLIANGAQNGQLPSGLLNGRLNLANLGLNLPFPLLDGKNQAESKSPPPDDDDDKLSETESLAEEKSEENSISKSSVTTPPSKPSESPAVSSKISSKETPPSPQLPQSLSTSSVSSATQEKPSPSSATQSTPPTPALDFSRTSKLQEEQFVSDDPFFKHKCRLCHKVFGSDSALQIHIRSHTDAPAPPTDPWVVPVLSASDFWTWEKPFKCNVCGGRFSTRGNLKVHFQRHKAEFPDIEMNPNPVPEHLDKTPNPFLASPFPTAALNPFATPAGFMGLPGLMNGLMFPSPHLAPRLPFGHPHIPNRPPVSDEKRPSSPRLCSSSLLQVKKETSPTQTAMEAPKYSSPNVKEGARIPSSSLPPASHTSMPSHFSNPSPVMPISSIPLVSNYPVMSPLPSRPPFPAPRPPSLPPSSNHGSDPFRSSILPANVLDNDDNLEQFMEIDKSETCKLQQLVDNIEHKLTDPNQCVICHRVLSCKSALQMHYRIHTGERPFKCKICGRSFTTKGNLKTHMGVHRAKPPLRMMHQCPVCHKQFTNLLVLQQHIRSHTGMANLPSIPNLSHIGMFGRSGPDFDPSGHQKPLNMTRPFPDYDRELDLSNKRPRLDTEERNENKLDNLNESLESFENDDNIDDVDDEQNEMDSIDEEANAQAAKDAENGRDLQGENLSLDRNSNESDAKAERPTANENADFYRRSPTPKYLQEAPSPSSESQNGTFNSYSTSLAALEERVRAIDSTMARNPLSQFHAAPFLLGPNSEPLSNGKRSLSPKSDSGSEINDKEGIKPSTPALSVSSEGSMGSNFMLGALDLRSQDGNSKNGTTCNVCFKTFACRSALDIHYRSHTKERPYKCDLCDRSFTTRGNMKQHMLTHKIRDSSNDSESSERNNNNSCTPNQNDNTSDNSNDSSNFEETLNLKRELDETVNEKDKFSPEHNENTPMSTSQCSNTRSSHVSSTPSRSSQSGSSPEQSPFISKTPTIKHQCLVCQKGFSSASALQIHIRTHTGDKPFKCNVCGKAFTTKGNLKVHMGTHMWNNSPSRRGRRMSIEPPFMLAHKENPYMPHGFPPRPEFYPFHIPPFMNGLPPKSLNEISVVQGLNNGLHGNHKPDLTSPRSDIVNHKGESPNSSEDGHKYTESGELDLSMKSTGSTGSRDSAKTSPSSLGSSPSSAILSPSQSSSLGWGWKASCHFCSSTFPSPMSLEYHIRTMHKESFHKVAAS